MYVECHIWVKNSNRCKEKDWKNIQQNVYFWVARFQMDFTFLLFAYLLFPFSALKCNTFHSKRHTAGWRSKETSCYSFLSNGSDKKPRKSVSTQRRNDEASEEMLTTGESGYRLWRNSLYDSCSFLEILKLFQNKSVTPPQKKSPNIENIQSWNFIHINAKTLPTSIFQESEKCVCGIKASICIIAKMTLKEKKNVEVKRDRIRGDRRK